MLPDATFVLPVRKSDRRERVDGHNAYTGGSLPRIKHGLKSVAPSTDALLLCRERALRVRTLMMGEEKLERRSGETYRITTHDKNEAKERSY